MDSKLVNKRIREVIKPFLKSSGFSIFTGRTSWRYVKDRIEIINFQSFNSYIAKVIGCTTYSFALNIGTYLTYIPKQYEIKVKNGYLLPEEYQCHLRAVLEKNIAQDELPRKDIWYVDDRGHNLDLVVYDALNQIENFALPWFERLTSDNEVYNILKNKDENMKKLFGFGRNPSPIRSFLIGFVSHKIGKNNETITELNKALNSGCFNTLSKEIQTTIKNAL